MRVGDLVKVLTVDGQPLGLVTDAWDSTSGGRQGYVKICGRAKQWIFRNTQVEVLNESR